MYIKLIKINMLCLRDIELTYCTYKRVYRRAGVCWGVATGLPSYCCRGESPCCTLVQGLQIYDLDPLYEKNEGPEGAY